MKQNSLLKTLYPWLIWALSAGFLFYKYMLEVSPSVMSHELMRDFNIHGAAMGNLASSYFYAYLLMQLPVGLLIDRYGPRLLTTAAIVLAALGGFVLAKSSSIEMACFGRFLTGTGAAFAAISCFKIITLWFTPNRFALMSGLMMTLGMLGAVFGQAPLAYAVNQLGWRDTLFILGIIGFTYAFFYYAIIRENNEINPQITEHPKKLFEGFGAIIKNKQNWLLSTYSGLAFAPVAVMGGLWGVPFIMESHQLTKTLAASDISLIFIGFAVGAPIFGFLSDVFGRRKPLIITGTLISIGLISISILDTNISNTALATSFFGFGFFISTFLISFTMMREVNNIVHAATALALMNTMNALLCALSDPLIGKFLDIVWDGQLNNGAPMFTVHDYQIGLSALPIFLIVGLIMFFFVDETYCKQVD